jgi:glutamate racemase
LLVPLVEEGWTDAGYATGTCAAQPTSATPQVAAPPQVAVTAEVIRIYLNELNAEAAALGMNPDTLVLGCTHYPLLRSLIERAVPPGMKVIDSAESAAEAAARLFGQQDADAPSTAPQALRCFATDSVEKFERLGSRFLGRPVGNVELVDLGG